LHNNKSERNIASTCFLTPQKFSTSANSNNSPPGATPSQLNGWKHRVEDEDSSNEITNELDISEEMQRELSTTAVLNIFENHDLVLQHIYSTFIRMSNVELNYRDGISKCLFKLHKNEKKITWHPIDSIQLDLNELTGHKFPRSNTKTLLAIEDLGRGSTGKAWLACTLSTKPAICV
jgi:hypothetical protein